MNESPQIPLKDLIQTWAPWRRELETIYDLLPATKCQRQVRCCSLLPEMTFLEALQAIRAMMSWPSSDRINITRKMVRYFFCNATKITSCPFLQGNDCLIYPDRFFGCRAYGLWSKEYYLNLTAENRQSKWLLQQQWEKLGISLPEEVIAFQVSYCSLVEPDPPVVITDGELSAASDRIEKLSRDLQPWDREFREIYFSDLSFFLAGLQSGSREAVRLKYILTRDMIQKKDKTRLDQALSRVTDPFSKELLNE